MNRLKSLKEVGKMFFAKEWSTTEKILIIVNCILLGTVLGIMIGPRKGALTIGSNNGNGMASPCDYEDGWIDEED